jgi:hypothetical protein
VYGRGKGLMLLVDGHVAASSQTWTKISATIDDGPVSPPLPKPPSPRPFPPPPVPPAPPAPPAPPVAGWVQLTNLTGEFCCDGSANCQPKLVADTTEAECMAKALKAGADYVTTTSIPKKSPGCFIAKRCDKQGKYRDTPSASYIRTWHKNNN